MVLALTKGNKMIDFDNMSVDELSELEKQFKQAIQARKNKVKNCNKEVIADFEKIAEAHGVSVADLVKLVKSNYNGKVAAKYKDPDSDKTWSGRGRKPVWVTECLALGLTLEQLTIN